MAKSTILVWLRADLRIHDHPALVTAIANADKLVPVFVLDKTALTGRFSSANRNRFLIECLEDMRKSLQNIGGDLVIRQGDAVSELKALAKELDAEAVYYTADYTPYALQRDKRVEDQLAKEGLEVRSFGGKLAVASVQKLATKSGSAFKVFTPFYKAWLQVKRRDVVDPPKKVPFPSGVKVGRLPVLDDVTQSDMLSTDAARGGESAARKALANFLDGPITHYDFDNNDMARNGTSRLSPYLHFGCLSVREIETMLPDSNGARAWHRQLAWREFYHYVLLMFPHPHQEFQERYRDMQWDSDSQLLEAWKDGKTGYPVVDAAMRQLKQEGWMHNRARLIVGSFLTKDLGIDWREGEAHFMQWLLDGDMANNNGNWQWIASVGVDPAPVFRRLYNPSSQRDKYDPNGDYVRRYVPELTQVPDDYLSEPWRMSEDEQKKYGCEIGKDYPSPVVDHKLARQAALERYRSA